MMFVGTLALSQMDRSESKRDQPCLTLINLILASLPSVVFLFPTWLVVLAPAELCSPRAPTSLTQRQMCAQETPRLPLRPSSGLYTCLLVDTIHSYWKRSLLVCLLTAPSFSSSVLRLEASAVADSSLLLTVIRS